MFRRQTPICFNHNGKTILIENVIDKCHRGRLSNPKLLSIDGCVSFVPIIILVHTLLANSQSIIDYRFKNVYSVMTLLQAENEKDNDKLRGRYSIPVIYDTRITA